MNPAQWQVITLWYSLFASWKREPIAHDPRAWYLPSVCDPFSK